MSGFFSNCKGGDGMSEKKKKEDDFAFQALDWSVEYLVS